MLSSEVKPHKLQPYDFSRFQDFKSLCKITPPYRGLF
jgi:hypothetical protein